jgi:phage baseplate assembly protein W
MDNKKNLGTDLGLIYKSPSGMCEDTDLIKVLKENPYKLPGLDFLDLYKVGDIATISGTENVQQSIINRIMTRKGELAALGHPEYGSKHYDLIGELNSESNRNLLKFYILECLSHEPRVEKILRTQIKADADNRSLVRIYLKIKIINVTSPINLIIPFNFEV